MRKPKILVVGSINMDLCMYGVDGMPVMGASSFCTGYQYAEGGKGSNQAFAVAKLGADAVMVGRVGSSDENGRKLLKSLENAGVHTEYIVRDPEHLTGMAIMSVLEGGSYYSIFANGANGFIAPEDVARALEQDTYDMVLMQLEMPLETVYRTYEMAREKGIPVFLDAGPAMHIPLERLNGIDYISPNETEAEALTGIAPESENGAERAAVDLYQKLNPKWVILKLGSRGVLLYDGKEFLRVPANRVEAVDTTAAGDTFGAAFIIKMCSGSSVREAVDYAQAAAALCVTRKGGHTSIPSDREVRAYLSELKKS